MAYGHYRKRMTYSFEIPLMKSTLIYHNFMSTSLPLRFHNLLNCTYCDTLWWWLLPCMVVACNFFPSHYKDSNHFSFHAPIIYGSAFKVFSNESEISTEVSEAAGWLAERVVRWIFLTKQQIFVTYTVVQLISQIPSSINIHKLKRSKSHQAGV